MNPPRGDGAANANPLEVPSNLRMCLTAFGLSALVGSSCLGDSQVEFYGPPMPGDTKGNTSRGPHDGSPALPVGPPGSPENMEACANAGPVVPAASPLRRLTHAEYDRTLAGLLGDTSAPSKSFPPEARSLGFLNNVSGQAVTELLAEQYFSAAEAVAARAVTNLSALLPCDPAVTGESACADAFIEDFGPRAFRAPLELEQRARLSSVYQKARTAGFDFKTGIELVIQTALQSPRFLYRVEKGLLAEAQGERVPLSSWEVASRLSYLLWGTLPDEALFAAARADALRTQAQVAVQVDRMIADARARALLVGFHDEWLRLDEVDHVEKDAAAFPLLSKAMRTSMRQGTQKFVEHVLFEGTGTVKELLTAEYAYIDGALAPLYGVTPAPTTWTKVTLDPSKRVGLLTQPSLLTIHAKANQTSPVLRGLFVREGLFCQTPPPPPEDADIRPPDPSPDLTTRERYAEHSANAVCAGCHKLMDPIGLGFEHYDAIGAWRDLDAQRPVDASGELVSTDVDGTFSGVPALANRLADSALVQSCMTTQWYRYAHGRAEGQSDLCEIDGLARTFGAAGGNIPALVRAIATSEGFLTRRATLP